MSRQSVINEQCFLHQLFRSYERVVKTDKALSNKIKFAKIARARENVNRIMNEILLNYEKSYN